MTTLQTIQFIRDTPFLNQDQKDFWEEAFRQELPAKVRNNLD